MGFLLFTIEMVQHVFEKTSALFAKSLVPLLSGPSAP